MNKWFLPQLFVVNTNRLIKNEIYICNNSLKYKFTLKDLAKYE